MNIYKTISLKYVVHTSNSKQSDNTKVNYDYNVPIEIKKQNE